MQMFILPPSLEDRIFFRCENLKEPVNFFISKLRRKRNNLDEAKKKETNYLNIDRI